MKRLFLALSLLLTLPLFALDATHPTDTNDNGARTSARRPLIIDDVIRMSQAGVGDDALIAYINKYRDRFDVNPDDLIALTDAHVSKDVIKAMVDESSARRNEREPAPVRRYSAGVYFDPWYYPSYYGYYGYNPFWYGWGPRFSIGLRFGGGHFHRGRH